IRCGALAGSAGSSICSIVPYRQRSLLLAKEELGDLIRFRRPDIDEPAFDRIDVDSPLYPKGEYIFFKRKRYVRRERVQEFRPTDIDAPIDPPGHGFAGLFMGLFMKAENPPRVRRPFHRSVAAATGHTQNSQRKGTPGIAMGRDQTRHVEIEVGIAIGHQPGLVIAAVLPGEAKSASGSERLRLDGINHGNRLERVSNLAPDLFALESGAEDDPAGPRASQLFQQVVNEWPSGDLRHCLGGIGQHWLQARSQTASENRGG